MINFKKNEMIHSYWKKYNVQRLTLLKHGAWEIHFLKLLHITNPDNGVNMTYLQVTLKCATQKIDKTHTNDTRHIPRPIRSWSSLGRLM